MEGKRSPRNKTVTLSDEERRLYRERLARLTGPVELAAVVNRTLCQDALEALDYLPSQSVDLVFADPPYNLSRSFGDSRFTGLSLDEYEEWLETWLVKVARILKPTGSLYVCSDWRSSAAVHRATERLFIVRNRITWEREKGRGARRNWKNCAEDIWFCTVSDEYTFNVEAVKLKRRVLAPYVGDDGRPRDWSEGVDGRFRLTYPSNVWTDLTVPFWSMPENTVHPTQKPEKLLAKVILASSNVGDVVLDPFLGSGTTSVVAKKLGRRYIGIEVDEFYCCIAEKRLEMAESDRGIQGYVGGVFWERNTFAVQRKVASTGRLRQPALFQV